MDVMTHRPLCFHMIMKYQLQIDNTLLISMMLCLFG